MSVLDELKKGATPKEVARWMVSVLREMHSLDQKFVVSALQISGNGHFVYENEEGGDSIDKIVLSEFRALTTDTVVWEKGEKIWRYRGFGDEPGRLQH